MAASSSFRFVRFKLIVTGKGEERFLPKLFRSLASTGRCSFEVLRRIGQRSPITSEKRKLAMVGCGKRIPDRDTDEIGLPARRAIRQGQDTYVLLIDDLEHARRPDEQAVFSRYRTALDTMLEPVGLSHRAAVFFLIPMLEAHYFADAAAINKVLSTALADHDKDVEEDPDGLRHPKNKLKELYAGFDEVRHGEQILSLLDLEHVLSRPATCASLRTLVAWCLEAADEPISDRYQLRGSSYRPVSEGQLHSRP